ncbi:MAG: hypothetical protein FP820_12415 [Sulfurimonas sp.]|nr:hypothetical protein [Sulfurimonas sp.]MBU3938635.1 FIST C-terminal domain-containing protein [bacterium]MBU4025171.1 FIST C-terminal domain-containing protein [bacterium]MBU4109969.1 FIST C-terminal domain-containing protein [bacterium]
MSNNQFVIVSHTKELDSYKAAQFIVQETLPKIHEKNPKLAILFYSVHHDAQKIVKIISDAFNEIDIVGGTSPGYITNDTLEVDQPYVSLAVLIGDDFDVDTFYSTQIKNREFEAGLELGEHAKSSKKQQHGILFYDSVKQSVSEGAPSLNMATPLISGISQSGLGNMNLAGIGVLADPNLQKPASIVCEGNTIRNGASLSIFSGDVQLDTITLHGCSPESGYYTVTKAEGPVIIEIENKPAIEFIKEVLGEASTLEPKDYPLFLTLGVNHGDLFDDYNPNMYANRLCLAVDESVGALIMFEPDLIAGTKIQIMQRNLNFSYISIQINAMKEQLRDREIVFALYLDCIGRWSRFCGSEEEEGHFVQEAIGRDIPLFGVYSGVEISKVGNGLQALDWTGVLSLFSIPRKAI